MSCATRVCQSLSACSTAHKQIRRIRGLMAKLSSGACFSMEPLFSNDPFSFFEVVVQAKFKELVLLLQYQQHNCRSLPYVRVCFPLANSSGSLGMPSRS
jgi:hypothetical protein